MRRATGARLELELELQLELELGAASRGMEPQLEPVSAVLVPLKCITFTREAERESESAGVWQCVCVCWVAGVWRDCKN